MSQLSKLKQSRQQWKQKAKERADQNRYLRKQLERLRQERDLAKQALKEAKQPQRQHEVKPTDLKAHRVWLALTLFASARISFRAVSRVLQVLTEPLGIGKAPCPQSVINWVMRLSLVRLQALNRFQSPTRRLIPFTNGLIWMVDASITLGAGKLLSILAIDAQHYPLAGCAPGFEHVRCVAVAVSPSWTGERLAALLQRVISVLGRPAAYLQDGGSELQKAADVLSQRGLGSPVINDISHAVANMLKRRYETHPQFATFLSACGRVSSRLKQSVLACLAPPKVHTKSRFMNVHRLVRWADWVLGLLPPGRAKAGSVAAKLRASLDELPACRTLIRHFRDDAVALLGCQQILKTRGLCHDTLRECEPLLDTMASTRVRQEFVRYLRYQLKTAKGLGLEAVGLPISSDPIESLFGLSKQHGVGPLQDANRIALRMPALCGVPTWAEAQQVLAITVAQQRALSDGVASLTQQRRQIRAQPHLLEQLGGEREPGNVELIPSGKEPCDRAPIIYFPTGCQELEEPLCQHHDASPTPTTTVANQVQKPVKS